MNVQELGQPLKPVHTADEIVANLPQGAYTGHYQPTYPDMEALRDGAAEVQSTETVTTPEQVDRLQARLTALAEGKIREPIVITERCAEEVSIETPLPRLVEQARRNHEIVARQLGRTAIILQRNRGQSAKPRSAELETHSDGRQVPSYMGDMINGADPDERTPDPSRMVAAAVQSRDLEAGLTEAVGEHVPAAHEALLVPYEMASIFEDPETGKPYLLSADMPWIGKRTNSLDGPHVAMLEGIANPIGIKIGSDSTAEHIAGLQAKLNPDSIAGKLTFMVRIGSQETEELRTVLSAIAEHAPKSIIMWDIHGVTKAINGQKIRAVQDIIEEVGMVSDACHEADLTLHGIHLETVMDDSRLECVDTRDQVPTHPGGVDPQLNPRQTEEVLEQVKGYLLRPTRAEIIANQVKAAYAAARQHDPRNVWGNYQDSVMRDGHL